MTNSGVSITSAKRRLGVSALGAVLLAATGAQAEVWDQFEQHCLTPLENVSLSQPETLKAHESFKNGDDTYSTYTIGRAKLAISDGRADFAQWCWVKVDHTQAADFSKQALTWGETAQTDSRYELIEERVLGYLLRSTTWREPKLEVSLTMNGKGSSFLMRVQETDLES